jgi:hypothetical protein
MIAIRKLGYSALILAAFAGCANEPAPTTPPETAKPEAGATSPPAETAKPEAGAEKGAAPSTVPDMPKLESPQSTPAPKEKDKEEAKPEEKKAAAVTLSEEEVAEIKKLPAGDAELALKQLVCPVSEENLGSMGVPVKVTAAGQTFFLCCKGCNKDVQKDPEAVVAKLKK